MASFFFMSGVQTNDSRDLMQLFYFTPATRLLRQFQDSMELDLSGIFLEKVVNLFWNLIFV